MDFLISTSPVHCNNNLAVSPFRPPIKTLTLAPLSPSPSLRPRKLSDIKISSSLDPSRTPSPTIRTASVAALVLAAASASLLSGRLSPARAGPVLETESVNAAETDPSSETIGSLKSLAYKKLEEGEDGEALAILDRLISHQPSETEWKFLAAKILFKVGKPMESIKLHEEILSIDPLAFAALFEIAAIMNQLGEGDAALKRLEGTLEAAKLEKNEKSVREVRLIIAQIKSFQKKVDEAMAEFEELIKEDPEDHRPYFCQGLIFSLIGREEEAREKFVKHKELVPAKFDVDACLETLSRARLSGIVDSDLWS